MLTSTGPATAAGDAQGSSGDNGSAAARTDLERVAAPAMRAGRYIVLLRQPSAATYDGSGRFARTRPTAGEQFDARSGAARTYRSHLVDTHE